MAKFGAPTLFITLTVNPGREEFGRLGLRNVNYGHFFPPDQTPLPYSRPDLIARVWNQFGNAFFDEVKKNGEEYFGRKVIAHCYKEEYQSRFMPHLHSLLRPEGGILDSPEDVDAIISAEMPREGESEEQLESDRNLVRTLMTHKYSPYVLVPVDPSDPNSPKICKFDFSIEPGAFQAVPETRFENPGNRVVYRRREPEDARIVPHNLKLLRVFRCHMNVERVQRGGVVAYLWKYMFKIQSTADANIHAAVPQTAPSSQVNASQQNASQPQIIDEIQMYRKKRRVGSTEACSRIFEHSNLGFTPRVDQVRVHGPGQRSIIVRNPNLPTSLGTSPLERYFERPFIRWSQATRILREDEAVQAR